MSSTSPSKWNEIFRLNFTRWDALADFLELTPEQRKQLLTAPKFPLNLPLRLAQKVTKGTLDDPILLQFLPTLNETTSVNGFEIDPVEDKTFKIAPRLLHKYEGRALLICTGACVMNCRFCFRQNFDYSVDDKNFNEALEAIKNDHSIKEVILSGGDPLSLPDRTLQPLLQSLSDIPHVMRIRFHTRFPLGIPERIDESFLAMLQAIPKQIWFILHTNHSRELDADVLKHLKQMQKLGVVILSQTVLLRGVNDSCTTLKELCEKLVDNGIFPYYLHQLDRVQGAAHFEVSEDEGRALIAELSKQISGYAVPKYVREIPGELSKTLL
jgi:EF-P beta-lysylation protein EpmB